LVVLDFLVVWWWWWWWWWWRIPVPDRMEELEDQSQEASGGEYLGRPGQLAMGPQKRDFTKLGWRNVFGLHIVVKDRWRTQQYAERVDHFWRRVQIRQLF
jgi:hypothetical protein